GGSRHLTVGGEHDGSKMGDQKEKIWRDKHLHVLRDHREEIQGNMSLHGGGDGGNQDIQIDATKKEHIKGTSHLHVEQGRIEWVQNGQSLTVDGDRKEYISGKENRWIHGLRAEQVDGDDMLLVKQGRSLIVNGALEATALQGVVLVG